MRDVSTGGPTSSPILDDPPSRSPLAHGSEVEVDSDGAVGRSAHRRIKIHGPGGALQVWLGGATDVAALEADVRAVSEVGHPRSAAAVAFGDVASRHGLEVRVVPRIEAGVPFLLVVFGRRMPRYRR